LCAKRRLARVRRCAGASVCGCVLCTAEKSLFTYYIIILRDRSRRGPRYLSRWSLGRFHSARICIRHRHSNIHDRARSEIKTGCKNCIYTLDRYIYIYMYMYIFAYKCTYNIYRTMGAHDNRLENWTSFICAAVYVYAVHTHTYIYVYILNRSTEAIDIFSGFFFPQPKSIFIYVYIFGECKKIKPPRRIY